MTQDPRSARELYDESFSGWARTQPSSLSDFTARPAVLDMCRPWEGLRVLDLGCGEGYCARALKRGAAAEVLAIDVSGGMIETAKREETREPLGITYEVGDALELRKLQTHHFDRVLAMFLFNYLTADQTRTCMREVARVLSPGGRFVFAVPHPSLPWLREKSAPFYFDVGANTYFAARNTRFPGKIWKRDGSQLEVQLVHKTLEDYFEALEAAGFDRLPRVRELRVTPEILKVDPAFFGPLGDTPLHMAISVER
jgi:ubiquinone/menaquinone biosynthesis C-methylase UbiE